ncbi:kinesin-like protein KIF20B [Scomber scombrus]|uniref:Kinesin-like protein KIF20B n=1 Tax=Scomber scombrus TaxID=13677 RepID=A0AAV1QEW9_SCOSC
MMETCPNSTADRQEQVEVEADDLKRDLSSDCSVLPDPQQSSIEEREHLQVFLRIRPFTSAESDNGESQDCVTIESPDTVLLKPPGSSLSARLSTDKPLPQTGQRFQFSQVFGADTSQKQLFEGTVKDLVKDVLEGGNSLVFTYGITNAGKTFTFLGPDSDAGIVPRSLDVIFSSIDGNVFTETNVKPHRCQEVTRLTAEQQAEEAAFKRNLFRQLKDSPSERINASLLNSTNKTILEGSSVLGSAAAAGDRISLEVETNTKFSVWVSFCEIYNENIHDLLEAMPSKAPRRTALRLSQDVKGNTYVKDLRWVQVNSADEAYKVMKLGKNNQSFSSTKLNQVSSRSHSVFSVRILRIEDVGSPRVHTVSELCLCDLAGSERCAKTQNKGERLKEAGNINTSLLILGKCINALRHNQQAKLLQHVPFRESKLTHYLQGFFCGRGKAGMIVNVNQCASMYDETLNVLKFSAVAQKVVVLSSRLLPIMHQRSASEVSFINNAERKVVGGSGSSRRRSSLIGWESSLEDVQEDDDDECDEGESLMDDTVDQSRGSEEDDDKIVISKKTHQKQASLLQQLQVQLKQERAESLLLEVRVRDEISREFSELFSEMQNDYNDRLSREREILEDQAERRMEIFKNLIDNMVPDRSGPDAQTVGNSVDSCEAAGVKKVSEAAGKRLCSGRAAAQGDAAEETEVKKRRRVEEQTDRKTTGGSSGAEDEEKSRLLLQLQQKTSEVSQLEKRAADLRSSHEREQLKQLSAALEREKKAREDALTALEYQTMGKEEALASLEEERKAREETLAALRDLKKGKEEAVAALGEERRGKEEAVAALGEERRGKEEAVAALGEERRGKEEAVAALEEERRGKEEAVAALEEERRGKEEAVAALEEERRGKEEAVAALEEEKRGKEEAEVALEEERRGKEEAVAALGEERRGKEEAVAALGEERRGKEEAEAALEEEKRAKQEVVTALAEEKRSREGSLAALEARSVLEAERKEISKLAEEREKRQQEDDELQQEVREMAARVKAAEQQVTSETERAQQALVQLQAAQAQLDEHSHEIQEKTSQIHTLTQEVRGLKEELQTTAAAAGGVDDQLREEVSDLKKNLSEEKEKSDSEQKQKLELQDELERVKEELATKQLISEQQLEQQEAASRQQLEELRRKKLQEREEDELRVKLEEQTLRSEKQVEELNEKLREQEAASKQQLDELRRKLQEREETSELNEKLRGQEESSQKQLEELKEKLSEEKDTSDKLIIDLKQQLSEQEKTGEMLKSQLEEAKCRSDSNSAAEDDLKRLNSELHAEVASLKEKLSNVEEKTLSEAETRQQTEEKTLSEVQKASEEREAELQKKLQETEAKAKTLQKSLKEAQERREEEESQAVQEARRREAERRRELLAVAHEAIAQKDEELEKKAEEISRLKENAKQETEKVKSLGLDLQRREDDTSDLREKLADYKKQIQQVQKEISTMREEERVLRQKLSDAEKTKKQLQCDVANRDRSIQQLRVEQSSDAKSDQTLQLYQKASKDLEAKERIMEDMRLALTEQEETQEQMDEILEEKLNLITELTGEVEKLKGKFLQQDRGNAALLCHTENPSDDVKVAKQEAAQAQERLKLCTEKHQAERRKWLEEKMSLIAHAKEAEDKRNQEMRKFADDRERYARQQRELESLSSRLAEKDQTMEQWRKERDTLVAALEVQLQKLLSSQAEKDKQQGVDSGRVAELESALSELETETLRLKEELKAAITKQVETPVQSETINRKSGGRKDIRASVSSQGSTGYPSVLDSSEISTDNGRTSRFPRPELEISFSPLQPNRMALRRQGEENAVTVKITRSARKRKSGEMEKNESIIDENMFYNGEMKSTERRKYDEIVKHGLTFYSKVIEQ